MESSRKKLCLRIGTRGSRLALQQTALARQAVQQHYPQAEVQIQIIHTTGDKILDKGLSEIGEKGLFTGELEQGLMQGSIDLAVHSMKDLPGDLPEPFTLAAVLPRENPSDVLISPCAGTIQDLPAGAVIGTSSLRRSAQLKYLRPDIQIVSLRGNIETRIRKMYEQHLDGILLAWAGLHRLGIQDCPARIIPLEDVLPAVGQGIIAIEMRRDSPLLELVSKLNDPITYQCAAAERAFLKRLEGGCQIPLAALAQYKNGQLYFQARVVQREGRERFEHKQAGYAAEAEKIGIQTAEILLRQGAGKILDEIRLQTGGTL